MMDHSLPPPHHNQAYFDISAIHGGTLTATESTYISPDPTSKEPIPTLSFVLRHTTHGTFHLFDLGLRKDFGSLPPYAQEQINNQFTPCIVQQDVHEVLHDNAIDPDDIETVFLSHVHRDHIGDQTFFRNAQFVLLKGFKAIIDNGYPHDPARSTPQNTVPSNRSTFLDPHAWEAIGPFKRSFDYFSDGSLYLIDAPGHLPGHLNALVRANEKGDWVYLAGDTVHDNRILKGEKGIAVLPDPTSAAGGTICAHVDKEAAEDHLKRVRLLLDDERVLVILAHDAEWYDAHKDVDGCYPLGVTFGKE